ncbi:MAG: hypothetical protein ACJAX4_004609, partial [Clostridium sp.]
NYTILSLERMHFILYDLQNEFSLRLLKNDPQRLAHIRNVT